MELCVIGRESCCLAVRLLHQIRRQVYTKTTSFMCLFVCVFFVDCRSHPKKSYAAQLELQGREPLQNERKVNHGFQWGQCVVVDRARI